MRNFVSLTGIAASLPDTDIDTDVIFPARFLLLLDRQGLGRHLFHERRRVAAPGQEPFVLSRAPFDKAEILVTGRNFGCGSSREQAVWALADFGIRCVIAPSFGEIFFNNCFRNGVLPITFDEDQHRSVMTAAESGQPLTVDLETQVIRLPGGQTITFDIDPHRRRALLLGLDQIGGIMADDAADIAAFESRQRAQSPWLYLDRAKLSHFDNLRGKSATDEQT
jgi:3-isopropylmalate/(R)-2-methylmalate dehydratase small subunit